MIRLLHILHRWLGIMLGLMVLLWFISGLVMLFVARPQLDEAERLAGLPVLSADSIRLSPAAAWQALNLPGAPQAIRLNAADGRPAYRILAGKLWWSIDAATGQSLASLDAEQAANLAQPYLGKSSISHIVTIDVDQWTVFRKFDALRPFWRVELDDGRELYLSTRTHELALDTTSGERAWNWLGSVVHWIYITPLRQNTPLWRNVLLWGSFFALLLTASGLWLGWQRLRLKQRYREGRISPYRAVWKRWHHLLGLAGGAIVLTWLFSGWMSMAPFGIAASPKNAQTGTDLAVQPVADCPVPTPGSLELEWSTVGQHLARLDKQLTTSRIALPGAAHVPSLSLGEIEIALGSSAFPVARSSWLDHADTRYFSLRHYPRTFPVARIELADDDQTILYVSPRTGRTEVISNRHDFAFRWLYQGLHRFDIPFMVDRPLIRDVSVITLSLLGMVLSITGCVLGWRRLFPNPEKGL